LKKPIFYWKISAQIPSPAYYQNEVKSPRTKYCTICHISKEKYLLSADGGTTVVEVKALNDSIRRGDPILQLNWCSKLIYAINIS